MALLLHEAEVRELLTMPATIAALEIAFRSWGQAEARNIPRQRIVLPQRGVLHVLPAAVPALDAVGLKTYTNFAGGARFVVLLASTTTGEWLAIIEADWLGRMRTGAASGLATQYLARAEAHMLGLIGTGSQAETQLRAVAAVRPLERALVWGRDRERLAAFCARMSSMVGFPVEPADSAEAAVRAADIVATITSAAEPVLHGEWLAPGAHVNVAGSNWHNRREIDDVTLARASRVVADSVDQAKIEAGDLIIPAAHGAFDWARAEELRDVVAGNAPGRHDDREITVFKSIGLGLEDVAAAMHVYQLARERGIGQTVSLG